MDSWRQNLILYNSLTRKKELFIPRKANQVAMYVCGMTVYDDCHIGHARVMIVFDMISRYLRNLGFDLKYVRNITDIDDKIINKAKANKQTITDLTNHYIKRMHQDEQALGCITPDFEPKATDHIPQMIEQIEQLINKGYGYIGDNGDVYYSVKKFAEYGNLANRNLEQLRAGERVAVNEDKKDPLDFVLWKKAKLNEPCWDSPFGKGRPGWHIECSAMSKAILGEKFDIHGGGMDLKFPHHECEIAQSVPVCGEGYVNYWLHNGFINIDQQKMSKSLGNFFTIRQVLPNFNGEIVRFFMLLTHYRQPINYSDSGLNEAKKSLRKLYLAIKDDHNSSNKAINQEFSDKFHQAMNDDFNTPLAIAVLFEVVKAINKTDDLAEKSLLINTLKKLSGILGLLNQSIEVVFNTNKNLTDKEINSLIEQRNIAKKQKDYAKADEIRAQLMQLGITLKDSLDGTSWEYL